MSDSVLSLASLKRGFLHFLLMVSMTPLGALPSFAGAPFATDDPQTPSRGGYEFDLAVRYTYRQGEASGVLPSLELDYGITPRLALHMVAANAFDRRAGDRLHVGYGDTELGIKYRMIDQDAGGSPIAMAIYPLATAHTGDAARGLGNGRPRLFLPVWVQHECDAWRFFGGGGYWLNPGGGNQDFAFVGAGLLRRLDSSWSLGGELFHATADRIGGASWTGFNLGAVYDFNDQHHVLVSAGRGVRKAQATNQLSVFVGYQLTR